MIVMGSQSGSVTNFPNWQENLKLALRLQNKYRNAVKNKPELIKSLLNEYRKIC